MLIFPIAPIFSISIIFIWTLRKILTVASRFSPSISHRTLPLPKDRILNFQEENDCLFHISEGSQENSPQWLKILSWVGIKTCLSSF